MPVLVTRNARHYRNSVIPVCSPEEYLALQGRG